MRLQDWRISFIQLKEKKLDVAVFVYCVLGLQLISHQSVWKDYLMIILSIGVLVCAVFQIERIKQYVAFFVSRDNDNKLSRYAGLLSLVAWIVFLMLLFAANVMGKSVTYMLAMVFSLLILVSSIFTILDLERNNNQNSIKVRVVAFSLFPLVYMLTSSYSASLFLQVSNLDISSSPWLEYCWKGSAFLMFFLWLSQPFCYGLFWFYGDKAKGYRIFTLTGAFIISVFLFFLIPRMIGDIAYYVLKVTTSQEWRSEAKCGQMKVSKSNERYFGFNTDKYTVFYFDRNDKWGFFELSCKKDIEGNDSYDVEPLPEYDIPKWLK